MMKKIWFVLALLFFGLGSNVNAGTVEKGLAGKTDLSNWGGTSATKTFTRSTSSGYNLTLPSFDWVGVDICQVYGGGALRTDAVINTALTAIGTSNKVTIFLSPGTWTISQSRDWSTYTNVTWEIPAGALISHGAYNLVFAGAFIAGPYQIFSGTGTVTATAAKTVAAYAEWFGLDGVDDGPAMTKVISAFHRLDGAGPGITYQIKTQVSVVSDISINGHHAQYNGHADLSGYMFAGIATGNPNAIPTSPIRKVRVENMNVDFNGSTGFVYLLGAHDVSIRGIDLRDAISATANTIGFMLRNCFGVSIQEGNFIGGLTSGSKGIMIQSDKDYTGYSVINNVALRDLEIHNFNYAVYMDINPSGSVLGGNASNTFVIDNVAFLGNLVGGVGFSYGIYFASGNMWNGLISACKSEDNLCDIYIHENAINYHWKIDGWHSKNAVAVFDFDSSAAAAAATGSIEVSRLRYTSAGASAPAGPWHVFKNIDCDLIYDGTNTTSNDTLSRYSYGLWNSDGVGTFRRTHRRTEAKTADYTVKNTDDNTLFTTTGAVGEVTFTLPVLAVVKAGFRVGFQCEASAKNLYVDPNGTERILKYTMAAGDYLLTSTYGAELWIEATASGWVVIGKRMLWRDQSQNVYDVSERDFTGAASGSLKTVTIPGGTLGKHWAFDMVAWGGKVNGGGGGNKTLKFTFGAKTLTFSVAANDTNDWKMHAQVRGGPTGQEITVTGINGGTTLFDRDDTGAEDETGDIAVSIDVVLADASDTISGRAEIQWIE